MRLRSVGRWLEVAGFSIKLETASPTPGSFAGEFDDVAGALVDGLSSPEPRIFYKAFDLWLESRALALRG